MIQENPACYFYNSLNAGQQDHPGPQQLLAYEIQKDNQKRPVYSYSVKNKCRAKDSIRKAKSHSTIPSVLKYIKKR